MKQTRIYALIVVVLSLVAGLSACAPVIIAGTVAGAGATLVSDRRTPVALIEDQAIEIHATDTIYADKVIGKQVRVAVTSFNGLVLLSGEAPSQELRLKVADIVRPLRGVREVYNEIVVADAISLDARTRDTWITSKVKARLVAHRGLFTRTKVVTSDGTVFLMGMATAAEAEEASSIVRDIQGINRVVALFEPVVAPGLAGKTVTPDPATPAHEPSAEPIPEEQKDLKLVPLDEPPVHMMSSD